MVGIDEVGRGSWAGPLLVVAARATSELPAGLTDSKLLTKVQREEVFDLLSNCCEFGEGWVTAVEIDKRGLAGGLKLGVSRALKALMTSFDEEIIFDGAINYISKEFLKARCIVGADATVPVVSAASIYAKVIRDGFMKELGLKYPAYGFENHVGYGTKTHQTALRNHGVLKDIHRTSYNPIKVLGT